jgi:integrase
MYLSFLIFLFQNFNDYLKSAKTSITYAAARIIVKKAGELVGIHLKPHDLRRHAATYASRSGTPIEIVSKVLLRHSSLAITQRYLGKISDAGCRGAKMDRQPSWIM